MNAKEQAFVVAVKAGRSLKDAATQAGYARPQRAGQRLASRFADKLAPVVEPADLDPATRLERTLARLDSIVSRGSDKDAVSAARPLLDEARQLVEKKNSPSVWVMRFAAPGMGPIPPASEFCLHVYSDDPEALSAAMGAMNV